jgi:hypothetical protein
MELLLFRKGLLTDQIGNGNKRERCWDFRLGGCDSTKGLVFWIFEFIDSPYSKKARAALIQGSPLARLSIDSFD